MSGILLQTKKVLFDPLKYLGIPEKYKFLGITFYRSDIYIHVIMLVAASIFSLYTLAFVGFVLLTIFIHELGHAFVAKYFGADLIKVRLMGGFGTTEINFDFDSYWSYILFILGGAFAGIFIGVLLSLINCYFQNSYIDLLVLILFIVNGANLLPFQPFDGGVIFQLVFLSAGKKFYIWHYSISTLIFIFLVFNTKDLILLIVVIYNLFILYISIKEANPHKELLLTKQALNSKISLIQKIGILLFYLFSLSLPILFLFGRTIFS